MISSIICSSYLIMCFWAGTRSFVVASYRTCFSTCLVTLPHRRRSQAARRAAPSDCWDASVPSISLSGEGSIRARLPALPPGSALVVLKLLVFPLNLHEFLAISGSILVHPSSSSILPSSARLLVTSSNSIDRLAFGNFFFRSLLCVSGA